MLQHRTSVHSFCPTSTNDRSRWHMRCNLTYAYGGPTIQILIAEDDPNVRSLVQNVVTDLGHAPSCANNGAEALDLYNAGGADVVVSDWMMPRMDGVELCCCVRSRQGAPYTYFILLTALDDSEHGWPACRPAPTITWP